MFQTIKKLFIKNVPCDCGKVAYWTNEKSWDAHKGTLRTTGYYVCQSCGSVYEK